MRIRVCLFIALMLGVFSAAETSAQTDQVPFKLVQLATHSEIHIDAAGPAGSTMSGLNMKFSVRLTCVSFTNTAPRTAMLVRFHFVYYDADGVRAGEDVLTRKGKFLTGMPNASFDPTTRAVYHDACVDMHYPRQGIALNTYYVEQVIFEDGSKWEATEPQVPEAVIKRLLPGHSPAPATSPVPAPSPTPA